jgi:hypothetical protein
MPRVVGTASPDLWNVASPFSVTRYDAAVAADGDLPLERQLGLRIDRL